MTPNKYHKLKYLLSSMEDDVNKFYVKDNKSAGIRLRKTLRSIKEEAQGMRLEITEIKNKRKND